jgi:hypothetical protein
MKTTIKEILDNLEKDFSMELINSGVELHPDTLIRIQSSQIAIGIKEEGGKTGTRNGSDVHLYYESADVFKRPNRINFGTSGSFDPHEDSVAKVRALHAASLILNWDKVDKLITKYCQKYSEIIENATKKTT